jgi:hypothetical protein
LHHDIERDTPAVDDREAGGDRLSLDRVAVIAGKHGAVALVEDEAAGAEGEVTSRRLQSGGNVGGIVCDEVLLQQEEVSATTGRRSPAWKAARRKAIPSTEGLAGNPVDAAAYRGVKTGRRALTWYFLRSASIAIS